MQLELDIADIGINLGLIESYPTLMKNWILQEQWYQLEPNLNAYQGHFVL